MKSFISIGTIVIAALIFQGCYYDKADLVYPNTNVGGANCDTANMKYSVEITAILSANCYSCHSGNASNGGGFKLDAYPGIKNMVNNGRLYSAITHSGGASAMPKNAPKLSDCNIAKIKAWIDRGAPQN